MKQPTRRIAAAFVLLSLSMTGAASRVSAEAPPPFRDAGEAFLAGVKGCSLQFDAVRDGKPFGNPKLFSGFVPAQEDVAAPGVRSLTVSAPGVAVFRAALGDSQGATVHIVSGPGPGGLPQCRTVAVSSPGVEKVALAWLQGGGDHFEQKVAQQESGAGPERRVGLVYGRPLRDGISIAASLLWLPDAPQGGISALSTVSLAR